MVVKHSLLFLNTKLNTQISVWANDLVFNFKPRTIRKYRNREKNWILNPRSRVLLEQLTDSRLVRNSPHFMVPERFITAFTRARHLTLSWARSAQFMPPFPHPTSWSSTLILSSHLRLGLPSSLYPPGFPTETLYTPLISSIHTSLFQNNVFQ